jgi:hypothetical protein
MPAPFCTLRIIGNPAKMTEQSVRFARILTHALKI